MNMEQLRVSIPFIGGPTAVFNKEEVEKMKEKAMNKLNDKGFQAHLWKYTKLTLIGAVVTFGLVQVWKWYYAYKILGATGAVVKTTLLGYTACAGIATGSVVAYNLTQNHLARKQAAALGATDKK